MADLLTLDQLKTALPVNLKRAASQSLLDRINTITNDPIIAEQVRDNFISYTSVLQDGKFKTEDYLNAVMYVSHKLMGKSNQDAYAATFPKRWQQLLANGTSTKDISSYVSAYNKGKLVNLILEQTLVPSWVLNQDAYQKAINTQVRLMTSASSELVQQQAANSILTNLAKPKEAGPLVNIDMREDAGMNALTKQLGELAAKQKELIAAGMTTTGDIAGSKLIEAEPEEIEDGATTG